MTTATLMTSTQLVDELSRDGDDIMLRIMIREAGRIVDRLNTIDSLLSGDRDMWARVIVGRDGVLEVRVDHVLQEARQQTTVLRHLLAEITRMRGGGVDPGDADGLDGL